MPRSRNIVAYVLLTAGSVVLLFPFWWMLVISLSSQGAAQQAATSVERFLWYPFDPARGPKPDPHWGNYPEALRRIGGGQEAPAELVVQAERGDGNWLRRLLTSFRLARYRYAGFLDALANSVVITSLTVAGQVLSCSLVGYAFARLKYRGRGPLFVLMLATMMLPGQITMIPMFIMFRSIGWVDSILPLVVPPFFGSAFFIFMFRQFFAQQPEALLEAARVDGAGQLAIWWRIMMPLCKPVVAITAAFTFIGTWNDFLGPLIYLHTEHNYTLQIALNAFRSEYKTNEDIHWLMAASIVTMIPCVALFFVAQKQFVAGLNIGGVKG